MKNGRKMVGQSEEVSHNNVSDADNASAKGGKVTRSTATIVVSAEDNESVITCLATNPVISEGEIYFFRLFLLLDIHSG